MKALLLIVVAMTVMACGAAGPRQIFSSSGNVGFTLECTHSRENCLIQAGAMCGSAGYHILNESSHAGGLLADWLPGPVLWFNIQVECGPAPVGYRPLAATPTTTSAQVEASTTEAVDLGGLTVEMPRDVQRRKTSQVVSVGKFDMWVFETKLQSGVYVSTVADFSLNPGVTWDYNKRNGEARRWIDGAVRVALEKYRASGDDLKVESDKYVTVAGRPGRAVIFTSRLGLQTDTGWLMVLVEKTSPRIYTFFTLTKDDMDEKALRMALSIK